MSKHFAGDLANLTQMRLDMLQVSNVLVNIYDPLFNVGIKNPHKLLKLCPSMIFATMPLPYNMGEFHNDSSSTKVPTILDQALDQLNHLLDPTDLIQLILLYPSKKLFIIVIMFIKEFFFE